MGNGAASRSGGVVRPPGPGGGQWGGWVIVAVALAVLAACSAVALAGAAASALAGEPRWRWDLRLLVDVVRDGPDEVWPASTPAVFWTVLVTVVLAAAVVGAALGRAAVRLWRSSGAGARGAGGLGAAVRSLATTDEVRTLTRPAADARARQLCPSLAGRRALADDQVGLPLGRLEPRGPQLRASWEDVGLTVMAPRAGKTTALAVPLVLAAPGAALVTSNKADVLVDTIGMRRGDGEGRCWVFDPQQIAHTDQDLWWNPLGQVHSIDEARRLASHFLQEVAAGGRDNDFWNNAGLGLLASLLLAAAASGQTLAQVWEWLNDSTDPTPARLLDSHGHRATASGLRGRQSGAWETREGIYENARTAAQCLESAQIMGWVTPQPDTDELRPETLPASVDTLYLLSKEDAGAAQPLVAALADQTLQAAQRLAEATAAGRLDPPLVAVLDEAANVCKIRNLPKFYSHLGSRGVTVWTVLQSYRQGQGVWGDLGMGTLWGAATVKVVGAGVDDPRLAEDLSRLIGEHEITTVSYSRGRGSRSTSTATRRQRILGPEDVRSLPKWRALLLVTGSRVALLRTQSWRDGPHAARILASSDRERAALAGRARHRAGPSGGRAAGPPADTEPAA